MCICNYENTQKNILYGTLDEHTFVLIPDGTLKITIFLRNKSAFITLPSIIPFSGISFRSLSNFDPVE